MQICSLACKYLLCKKVTGIFNLSIYALKKWKTTLFYPSFLVLSQSSMSSFLFTAAALDRIFFFISSLCVQKGDKRWKRRRSLCVGSLYSLTNWMTLEMKSIKISKHKEQIYTLHVYVQFYSSITKQIDINKRGEMKPHTLFFISIVISSHKSCTATYTKTSWLRSCKRVDYYDNWCNIIRSIINFLWNDP